LFENFAADKTNLADGKVTERKKLKRSSKGRNRSWRSSGGEQSVERVLFILATEVNSLMTHENR